MGRIKRREQKGGAAEVDKERKKQCERMEWEGCFGDRRKELIQGKGGGE